MKIFTVNDDQGIAVITTPAQSVEQIDGSVRRLAGKMIQTMRTHRGIGLAAPQVGVGKRLIVTGMGRALTLVNPEIIEKHGQENASEGCLSVPGVRRNLARAQMVRVRYRDRKGREQTLVAEGLFARILQHEIDHLDGILIGGRA